jgi:hypothetical protein
LAVNYSQCQRIADTIRHVEVHKHGFLGTLGVIQSKPYITFMVNLGFSYNVCPFGNLLVLEVLVSSDYSDRKLTCSVSVHLLYISEMTGINSVLH